MLGRDVVPNVPDLFGGDGPRAVRADVAQRDCRQPGDSSFARLEENKWDAGDSVRPH